MSSRHLQSKYILPLALTLFPAFISGCAGASSTAPMPAQPGTPTLSKSQTNAAVDARKPHTTKVVDMRNYMAATIGGTPSNPGQMLCSSKALSQNPPVYDCKTSVSDATADGETKITNTDGTIGYVAITSATHSNSPGSSNYIGVIRSYDTNEGDGLRCYATHGNICASPADSYDMPEAVPYLINAMPVVSAATELASEDGKGHPEYLIAGAMLTTPNATGNPANYWTFDIHHMNWPTACVQGTAGPVTNAVHVVYVTGIDFGGEGMTGGIGVQDAVVVDEEETGSTSTHIERYFYVKGLGAVRSAVAYSGTGGAPYNEQPMNISLHNVELPINTADVPLDRTAQCGQGSYIPLD